MPHIGKKRAWLYAGVLLLALAGLAYGGYRVFSPSTPGSEPLIIQKSVDPEEVLRYRTGLFNMLLCVADYDTLNTITLISVTERGEVRLLSIPKDTRIKAPAGHAPGEAFTRLSDVFARDDGASGGEASICGAVSELLGGIPIHNCVTLDEHAIVRIIDAIGGVLLDSKRYTDYLKQVDPERVTGLQPSGEQSTPEWVCLTGDEAVQFTQHTLMADAQGALLPNTTDVMLIYNTAHLVDRLIERMRERGPNQTVPLMLDAASYTTMDDAAQLELITRFNKPVSHNAFALLIGEEYKLDFYCWLPDLAFLKQWVIDMCYELR